MTDKNSVMLRVEHAGAPPDVMLMSEAMRHLGEILIFFFFTAFLNYSQCFLVNSDVL